MELWIRSRDKELFIKAFEIRLNWQNDNEIIANSYTTDCCDYDYRTLGTYATKERALEVLDEIQSKMKQQFIVKSKPLRTLKDIDKEEERLNWKYDKDFIMQDIGFEIEPINTGIIVYEMPNE